MPLECSESIERTAQRYHAKLVARAPTLASPADEVAGSAGEAPPPADFQEVDVDSLQMTQPRSVGVDSRQPDRENGSAGVGTGDLERVAAAQRPG